MSASGLNSFAPDSATWHSYAIQGGFIHDLAIDALDGIWCTSDSGVTHIDPASGKAVLYTDASTGGALGQAGVVGLAIDDRGRVWCTSPNNGVVEFDPINGSWTHFTSANTGGQLGDDASAIVYDHRGRIWVAASSSAALSCYDFASGAWTLHPLANCGLTGTLRSMAADRTGRIWLDWDDNTFIQYDPCYGYNPGGGLTRFDGRFWTSYTPANTGHGLPTNIISAVYGDPDGSVWAGTNGVTRYDGAQWTTYLPSGCLGGPTQPDIGVLIEDQRGNLWMGHRFGASCLRRTQDTNWESWSYFATVGTGSGPGNQWVDGVIDDKRGRIYFCTVGAGVNRWDPDSLTWKTFTAATTLGGLPSNYASAAVRDSTGAIWIATDAGVARFDPEAESWQSFTNADAGGAFGNDPGRLCLFVDHAGRLWTGTGNSGDGLAVRDPGTGAWQRYTNANTSGGLPGDAISSISEDREGRLWIGSTTYGNWSGLGVTRFDPKRGQWTTYPNSLGGGGIPAGMVGGVVEDERGLIWVSTTGGLARFNGDEWKTMTPNDTEGGPSNFNLGTILQDAGGTIWIASSNGLIRYEPDRAAPHAAVTVPPRAVSINRSFTLPLAPAYGDHDGVEYSAALSDTSAWSTWSRTALWTAENLSDGSYSLYLRARDAARNVDDTPARFQFEVDATAPEPIIEKPAPDQAVRGVTPIQGTAQDARFASYELDVRPFGAASWEPPDAMILARGTKPITDAQLAAWDTRTLADGEYELRLAVQDTLGLTGIVTIAVAVDNVPPYADVTSPVRVLASTGGEVYSADAKAHAYFPPQSFPEDAVVRIDPLAQGEAPAKQSDGARLIGPGFRMSWGSVALKKVATFDMESTGGSGSDSLAFYASSDGVHWTRRGGTFDAKADRLAVSFDAPLMWAIYSGSIPGPGNGAVTDVTLSPRVLGVGPRAQSASTTIGFSLGKSGPVTVKVYSRSGRLVRNVVDGVSFTAGANVVRWDGRDEGGSLVGDGLYVITVAAFRDRQSQILAVSR